LQDDRFDQTDSFTCCPFTTDSSAAELFRPQLEPDSLNGLRQNSRLMVDKITTSPKTKLGQRIGRRTNREHPRRLEPTPQRSRPPSKRHSRRRPSSRRSRDVVMVEWDEKFTVTYQLEDGTRSHFNVEPEMAVFIVETFACRVEGKSKHFWVNGVVAARNHQPYMVSLVDFGEEFGSCYNRQPCRDCRNELSTIHVFSLY
jgi:mRNA interferase MazF